MLELVTIEEARHQLRIDDYDSDGGPDDPWLNAFIPAISEAIAEWVKVRSRLYMVAMDSNGDPEVDSSGNPVPVLDSSGEPTVKPLVKAAVLVELERQYRSRGGEDETFAEQFDNVGYGYVLGRGSTALLYSLRKPTLQ